MDKEFDVDGIRTARLTTLLGENQLFVEKKRSFELWEVRGDMAYTMKRWDKKYVLAVHYKKNDEDTWSVV